MSFLQNIPYINASLYCQNAELAYLRALEMEAVHEANTKLVEYIYQLHLLKPIIRWVDEVKEGDKMILKDPCCMCLYVDDERTGMCRSCIHGPERVDRYVCAETAREEINGKEG